jgi:hypothetical protein
MRGAGLVLLIFLGTGIFQYSRWTLPERVELPAVLRLQPQIATVVVADNEGNYGLYQFSDGTDLIDVIKLTNVGREEKTLLHSLHEQPVVSGELIKVIKIEGKSSQVERSWISARHRILLRIPLHPDRMTPHDWETLPGIGPKLAGVIEADRQKNGDFNEFSALKRVKGIGLKKLEVWQEYFTEKSDQGKNL